MFERTTFFNKVHWLVGISRHYIIPILSDLTELKSSKTLTPGDTPSILSQPLSVAWDDQSVTIILERRMEELYCIFVRSPIRCIHPSPMIVHEWTLKYITLYEDTIEFKFSTKATRQGKMHTPGSISEPSISCSLGLRNAGCWAHYGNPQKQKPIPCFWGIENFHISLLWALRPSLQNECHSPHELSIMLRVLKRHLFPLFIRVLDSRRPSLSHHDRSHLVIFPWQKRLLVMPDSAQGISPVVYY